ncbi:MAG: class IV adenylate cyclase [Candidatus Woesearchaeota archaeon]
MEVEIRFKDTGNVKDTLVSLGAVCKGTFEEHDVYYTFEKDTQRLFIMRFRQKHGKTILTFKGSSKSTQDIAWQEWEQDITDAHALQQLLISNGFNILVEIKKTRTQFTCQGMQINIDTIQHLGNFVEIESIGEDVDAQHKKILDFAQQLGIAKKDIITKGYVKLMLGE